MRSGSKRARVGKGRGRGRGREKAVRRSAQRAAPTSASKLAPRQAPAEVVEIVPAPEPQLPDFPNIAGLIARGKITAAIEAYRAGSEDRGTEDINGRTSNLPSLIGPEARAKARAMLIKHLAQTQGPDSIATLVEIRDDPTAPHMARKAAAESILDRGFGKAAQELQVTGAGGGPLRTVIEIPSNGRALMTALPQEISLDDANLKQVGPGHANDE